MELQLFPENVDRPSTNIPTNPRMAPVIRAFVGYSWMATGTSSFAVAPRPA
jgi:hypothetical protein